MHRVELKARLESVGLPFEEVFLMHRVELKGCLDEGSSFKLVEFLMHRVELKVHKGREPPRISISS